MSEVRATGRALAAKAIFTIGGKTMSGLSICVSGEPEADEVNTIKRALADFNEADVGPANRQPIAVLVHDPEGELIGGISGYTAWGWLYVQWLWVAESQRGLGLAGQMLSAAEAEARTRGCHGAYIDTFSPVALRAYERAGYVRFGALEDFPKGRTRTFLSKAL